MQPVPTKHSTSAPSNLAGSPEQPLLERSAAAAVSDETQLEDLLSISQQQPAPLQQPLYRTVLSCLPTCRITHDPCVRIFDNL
mmetsp:Transcript_79459/g.157454  ORF Transcript_79459/g.157454 Transcript_79459/m.157454 type:complete len:83 (-) Transcript_79459:3-251(-)